MFNLVKKHILNIPGKRVSRKYLIFESDDWGSIRMPSRLAYEYFRIKGYVKKDDPFARYDALESEQDLAALFEVLSAFKDSRSNTPVITANTVVCNPDFDKIKASGFSEYHAEVFTETLKRYPTHANTFSLWRQGMEARIFFPQFHAREHLSVPLWMKLLQKGHTGFLEAFDRGCFSIDFRDPGNHRTNLMAAYDYRDPADLAFISRSIDEGLTIFQRLFGYQSVSTISPCYVWDQRIEEIFKTKGIHCLQGSKFQNFPAAGTFKRKFHYNGERNERDQIYLIRNCLFEPSLNSSVNWVDKCLESIAVAFQWGKPAIIGTHRINYTGFLDEKNRTENLLKLRELISQALRRWPDIEFLTTADLAARYIAAQKN